jgi:hypothetical protein
VVLKEEKDTPADKEETEDNVVTYTGFGFSGWKSGLQKLFLTSKGTIGCWTERQLIF